MKKSEKENSIEPSGAGSSRLNHDAASSWCYLFIRRSRTKYIIEKLQDRFEIFVHKTVIHTKGKTKVTENLRPTISGLVFVHGRSDMVQSYLNENFQGLYLVKDCSTGKPAVIKDRVMSSFMQVSQINPNRLRFMPHAFDYYSTGHTLVRVVSGVLSGLEGYIVRISRDKCLVTSMGGMTVAIGGVCKETFENVEEYIRQRREQQGKGEEQLSEVLEEFTLAEMDECFFSIQNDLDVLAVAKSIDRWLLKAEYLIIANDHKNAVAILLHLIDNVGKCLEGICQSQSEISIKPLADICREADKMLGTCCDSDTAHLSLKEYITAERQTLVGRYPYVF